MNTFHFIVRWGLGIHGAIHIFEFVLNILEQAWASAFFTLVAGSLMLAGAFIDFQHHTKAENKLE